MDCRPVPEHALGLEDTHRPLELVNEDASGSEAHDTGVLPQATWCGADAKAYFVDAWLEEATFTLRVV